MRKELEKTNPIVKCTYATGIMKKVFYRIWQYQTGQRSKTPLDFLPGYADSKNRYIYKKVNGVLVEHIVKRNGQVITAYPLN